jgi:hypothetical protein
MKEVEDQLYWLNLLVTCEKIIKENPNMNKLCLDTVNHFMAQAKENINMKK